MTKNKEKITKEEVRRIWTIIALSKCEECTQNKLINYLNKKSTEILNSHAIIMEEILKTELLELQSQYDKSNLKKEVKITEQRIKKPIISKVLKSLKTDKIIDVYKIEKNKRGPNPDGYILNCNYKTFYKILNEILYSKFDQYTSSVLANIILTSKYAEKLVKKNLIGEIEKKYNFQFDNKEKESILELIKVSPRALHTTLNHIVRSEWPITPYPSFKTENGCNKNTFIFLLQLKLGEDIIYLSPLDNKKIKYEINVSLGDQDKEGILNEQKIESTLIPRFNEESNNEIFSNKDLSPL